jgi:uncharacterized protein YggE
MKDTREWWLRIGLSTAMLLLGGLLILTLVHPNPPAAAAQAAAPAPQAQFGSGRSITVVGEGQVKIQPDMAQINIGIEVISDTVKGASKLGADTMAAVMAALKDQGVADKDMQTSGYSVWVERPYTPEGQAQDKAPIYHVSNSVSVTILALDKVGSILDAAIEAGANNIYGVTFSLVDPTPLMAQAREKAVADAKAKAQDLAKLNDVTLGDVVSVSEVIGSGTSGGYYPGFGRLPVAAQGMGGGGGGPISPGELQMTSQLQVTYAIEQVTEREE